jgi:hypothetical protein
MTAEEFVRIVPELEEALRAVPPSERDVAAVALAFRYAAALDSTRDAELLSELGPKLLACLTALGLTVAGRGQKGGQANAAPQPTKLSDLRARARHRRAGGAG